MAKQDRKEKGNVRSHRIPRQRRDPRNILKHPRILPRNDQLLAQLLDARSRGGRHGGTSVWRSPIIGGKVFLTQGESRCRDMRGLMSGSIVCCVMNDVLVDMVGDGESLASSGKLSAM